MLKALEQRINHRYGSKRGFVRYYVHRGADLAGCYRKYRQIDWGRVERLVFVCSGNICRSPLAERVALDAGYNATSFGLHCTPGRPADPRVVAWASTSGHDLLTHRTRTATEMSIQDVDLLIAMEPMHLIIVRSDCLNHAQQTLLGLWHEIPSPYIHDPFCADAEYFTACATLVDHATQRIIYKCRNARIRPGDKQFTNDWKSGQVRR